jgi:hypothetical protein
MARCTEGKAFSKVQGRVPGDSQLVTVTKVRGRILGRGRQMVTVQQSDSDIDKIMDGEFSVAYTSSRMPFRL